MKNKLKKIFIIVYFYSIQFLANSQSLVANTNDLKVTCKTLKDVVNYQITKKDYIKAVSTILTFNHLNESLSVPQEYKQFFLTIKENNFDSLSNLYVSLNPSAPVYIPDKKEKIPQKAKTSRQARIIVTN